MEFTHLDEAGILSIKFNGHKLDAYSLGMLQINFQEIIDKVAYASFNIRDIERNRFHRYRSRRLLPPYSGFPIIKAEVQSISSGSLYEDICFLIPAVLADPDVRAVLTGLAANIIYSIGTSRIKNLQADEIEKLPRPKYNKNPNIDENMRDITLILAENGGGKITFKSKTPRGGEKEVTIQINGHN